MDEGTKTCSACKRTLERSEFHLDKRRRDGLFPYCKDCRRVRVGAVKQRPRRFRTKREYDQHYLANMDRAEKSRRAFRGLLWTKYRLDPSDYDLMVEAQRGRCAICRQVPTGARSRLSVDHDHGCCDGPKSCGGCIRGLLCGNCNAALGMLKDDVRLLRTAIAYLERE